MKKSKDCDKKLPRIPYQKREEKEKVKKMNSQYRSTLHPPMEDLKRYKVGDIVCCLVDTFEVINIYRSPAKKHLDEDTYVVRCMVCGTEQKRDIKGINYHKMRCPSCQKKRYEDADKTGQKVCRRCGVTYPKESFRIRPNCRGGRNHVCHDCEVKKTKRPECLANFETGKKLCFRCQRFLSLDNFRTYYGSADSLTYMCFSCESEHGKEYRQKKKEEKGINQAIENAKIKEAEEFEKRYKKLKSKKKRV